MTNETPQELFERAIAALDLGQKDEAAELLKQVVEEDVENVDAWVALSKILADPDEKRIALSTILQLDPQNAYATAQMADSEREKSEIADAEELVPGITRKEARLIGMGLGLFTLVVCGLVFAIVISINSQRGAEFARATQDAVNVTRTRDAIETNVAQIILEQTEEVLAQTATAVATITPTLTPTRTPDLPDTPTPTITPTQIVTRLFDVPPDTIGGSLIVWGGRNPQSTEFLNLYQYDWQAGEISEERLTSDLVRNPTVDSSGTRLIYMRLFQNAWTIRQMNARVPTQGALDISIPQAQLNVRDPRDPRVSHGASFMVFTAFSTTTNTEEVFYYNLLSQDILRLTNDDANYRTPAVSNDGTLVAVIKEVGGAPDLVLIEANRQQDDGNYPQTPITNDGNQVVQSHPDFSPDGTRIVFAAFNADNPDDSDLYMVRLTGATATPPLPIVTSSANEITPFFSPDGERIAFVSDAVLDTWQVFIFDATTNTTYQVTEGEDNYYLGGWMN